MKRRFGWKLFEGHTFPHFSHNMMAVRAEGGKTYRPLLTPGYKQDDVDLCGYGLHYSSELYDAMTFAMLTQVWLARVEDTGTVKKTDPSDGTKTVTNEIKVLHDPISMVEFLPEIIAILKEEVLFTRTETETLDLLYEVVSNRNMDDEEFLPKRDALWREARSHFCGFLNENLWNWFRADTCEEFGEELRNQPRAIYLVIWMFLYYIRQYGDIMTKFFETLDARYPELKAVHDEIEAYYGAQR